MTEMIVTTNADRTRLELTVGELTTEIDLRKLSLQESHDSVETISSLLYQESLDERGQADLYVGTSAQKQGQIQQYVVRVEQEELVLEQVMATAPGFNVYDILPTSEGVLVAGAGAKENGVRYVSGSSQILDVIKTHADYDSDIAAPIVFGYLNDPLAVRFGSYDAVPESIAATIRHAGLDEDEVLNLSLEYERKNIYDLMPGFES